MSSFFDTIFSEVGGLIDSWGWADKKASKIVINRLVGSTRNRPHPWSTASDYTSWKGLTDRTYVARQLPATDLGDLPDIALVEALFARPSGKQRLSKKSTCLFPAFAQYLTDGFLRTNAGERSRTTSNHEIDLCPLYGRTEAQTGVLRLKDNSAGMKGRLRSQPIGGEEYPPFLYLPPKPGSAREVDPLFAILDRPLGTFTSATTITTQTATATTNTITSTTTLETTKPLPPIDHDSLFAVGGDRVNSTPFSAMMNTLLLREHNRIAGELESRNPGWDDEQVFQTARNIMIPLFIKIVIEQYINHITPAPFSLEADPSVAWDADWNRPNWMTAEFSLLYRWHSLMPDEIDWPTGPIPLFSFTLDNRPLINVGLASAFEAAASQPAGELGAFNTGAALMMMGVEHLAIQQGRGNRLASYNDYRAAYGLERAETFSDISSNPHVADKLAQTYAGDVNKVEFYPGLFAEDLVDKSPLPHLLMIMVGVDAFSQALTNPLLSEHVFNAETFTEWGLDLIKETRSLGDILKRQGAISDPTTITMTQSSWRYGWFRP